MDCALAAEFAKLDIAQGLPGSPAPGKTQKRVAPVPPFPYFPRGLALGTVASLLGFRSWTGRTGARGRAPLSSLCTTLASSAAAASTTWCASAASAAWLQLGTCEEHTGEMAAAAPTHDDQRRHTGPSPGENL